MPLSRHRVKTKTFTGCWTCRKRKVKCDEARPSCRQCITKHLQCAGYAARLQWLAPETSFGTASQTPATYSSTGMSLRRYMTCDKPENTLSEQDLDCFLDKIEVELPVAGISTIHHGPFAVFSHDTDVVSVADEQSHQPGRGGSIATPHSVDAEEPQYDSLIDHFLKSLEASDSGNGLPPVVPSTIPSTIPSNSPPSKESPELDLALAVSPAASVAHESNSSHGQHEHSEASSTPSNRRQINFGLAPHRLPENVEYLLHHYINHVVDLMTVVATPKGPWKSVHVPRALQGSAELALTGKTAHARNALLHALITISAYNVAANHRISGQELQSQSWREVALRCRARTLTYLKACLLSENHAPERGKYKEILAAMLSMVTIDVCSGETRSSEWHLHGFESFMQMSGRDPDRRYSRKAKSLHMVYVYLRIMRESTDLSFRPSKGFPRHPTHDTSHWTRPLCFLHEDSTSGSFADLTFTENEMAASACEIVYGVPFPLLILMSKTSELVRRKRELETRYPNSSLPQPFSKMCDELESEVLEWPVDRTVAGIAKVRATAACQHLIEHQTRAFHQAIVVFFSRLVRSIHRIHVQPYVSKIIDHLEAVEVIKHGANLTTGCILWPGFIGAAEAVDSDLQSRYMQWFRSTQFYGLGAYDKAREVVLEVWETQKGDKGQHTQDWSSILEEKDIKLMLT